MKERKIKVLNINYWQKNSPVRLLSAEYDPKTLDEVSEVAPISLTIQNISNQNLIAIKGSLRTYDIFKDYLDEIHFKWTEINIIKGKTEESSQSIHVAKETVHIELIIDQVVFSDYSVFDLESEILFIEDQIPIEYICKCGAINPDYNESCHKCGLELNIISGNANSYNIHDQMQKDETIVYQDASLGKIHLITSKNRIFAYGLNTMLQADPDSAEPFIGSWQDVTLSLTLDNEDPILSIHGRIAVTLNGRMFTWGLSGVSDDINPFSHNGLLIDPIGLDSIYDYLMPKYSELNVHEFKISQNFETNEMVLKSVASSDYMVVFLLTNKQRIFYWSYNIDQVLVYNFDPFNLIQLKRTPSKINDLIISENTLLIHDDENIYLYGHNYLKGLFEGQYNNYFRLISTPEFVYSSQSSGVQPSSSIKKVIANQFYKAFIIQYDNDSVYYMGYNRNFKSTVLNTDNNYKTGKEISRMVTPNKQSIEKLFFQRLAITISSDNTIYYWGIFSSENHLAFRGSLDITKIFPLEEEERIIDYFSDPGKVHLTEEDDSNTEYDQYFITSEHRVFALRYNDFLIAARVQKMNHFKIHQLDLKI